MVNLANIIYCPLDLPCPPKELTLQTIDRLYEYHPPSDPAVVEQWNKQGLYSLTAWSVLKLRTKPNGENKNKSRWFTQNEPGAWEWTETARSHAPGLIHWIEQYLPYKDLRYCIALSSVGTVKPHIDIPSNAPSDLVQYHKAHEPALYRIVLDGELINNGFYMVQTKQKKYVRVPNGSPGWVMNATSYMHGNDDQIRNRKILCYVMGELDKEKHYNLVTRSYAKYKEYAIVT